jgi:hypothetical protein
VLAPSVRAIIDTMVSVFDTGSFGEFLIAVIIDAVLAMLIFRHADRRGNRHATAWGVFTFLAAGVAIPVYFIRYWLSASGRAD